MKKLLILALAFTFILACKKEDEKSGINTEETIAKITTVINFHDDAAVKFKEAFTATGDTLESLIQMANWCLE